jgi:hypothetical protein
VPKEIALVGWHLVRPHPSAGVLERQAVRPTGKDVEGADAESERAAQMLAASFAPNRYVVDVVQGNALLMHRLAGRRP